MGIVKKYDTVRFDNVSSIPLIDSLPQPIVKEDIVMVICSSETETMDEDI